MKVKPIMVPKKGEINMGISTLWRSPSILWVTGFSTRPLMTEPLSWAEATVAPQSPPIKA